MEDFVTEGLAYFLEKDSGLTEAFLDALLGQPANPREKVRVRTQDNKQEKGSIIDLFLEWRECELEKSLLVENKVWARPHENQIEKYCGNQAKKGSVENDQVVLVSPYKISG